MGIRDGGEETLKYNNRDISSLKDAVVGENMRLSLTKMEKRLKESQDVDDLFVIRFVLVVIGTILCPTSGIHISTGYFHSLYDTRIKN